MTNLDTINPITHNAKTCGKSVLLLAGDYGQSPGLGLLRLHSTFRHDLKIYASDEGRVQMTAAAFAKVTSGISRIVNL